MGDRPLHIKPDNNKSPKKSSNSYPEFLEPYGKAYPRNKAFHVTTDRMAFLDNDMDRAATHQNSLSNDNTVKTYKI